MKNGFVIPIIVWIIAAAFGILAISKAGSTNNSGQTASLQPSPTPIIIPTPAPPTESDLINPVKQFYSDLSSDKIDSVWNLLSKDYQDQAQGYNNFVKRITPGNATIQDIYVQDISTNTVYVKLLESNTINSNPYTNISKGTIKLIREDGSWKLNHIDVVSDDPLVNCKMLSGDRPNTPKSLCDQYTDCQIGDKWVFYTSKDQCTADQGKLTANQNTDFFKTIEQNFMKASKDYNDCLKTPTLAQSGCIDALNILNSAARQLSIQMGTPPEKYELQDKISELENKQRQIKQTQDELDRKQRDLDTKIRDQSDCSSSGGRWNGSWCSH